MDYELIIERRQPSCGGKSPFKAEILNVTTDDPEAFVRSRESGAELETSTGENGEVTIEFIDGQGMSVKYIFTED
ncbi:MAG: hypothetical protein IKD88_09715 [Lachnospiraceae bacterium]|nr:hypothetical protein [Lachnospiraceae bacterium]